MKDRITLFFVLVATYAVAQQPVNWVHLSSKTGDIEAPNAGAEQTSVAVGDFNNDGVNDFCISERQKAPALVIYLRSENGWLKYPVENDHLTVEAGTTTCDVDGDGDIDIIAGGDWQSNEVWWWENPYPIFDKSVSWKRYLIRNSGVAKSHDQITGDFDGDGKTDIVFWAQGDRKLYFTRIPDNPKETTDWKLITVFSYFSDGQMKQHGWYPDFKDTNEHEGLAKADIDGDGIQDIVGGGYWFRYLGDDKFSYNTIDAAYTFSRSAVGQLVKGGRPEVVLVTGDGTAPMFLYQYQGDQHFKEWTPKELIHKVTNGHSLAIVDFDGDGNLDIWNAEMTLGNNTHAINHILLGDGNGGFPREMKISEGIDLHESEIADMDGDGDFDILGKPYSGDTPRLDIWLQNGTGSIVSSRAKSFSSLYGLELYTLRNEFKKDVSATFSFIKASGIKDVEVSGYFGKTSEEFKRLLTKNELTCSSMIFDLTRFKTDLPGIIREAKMFGAKYVGVGWIAHEQDNFGKEQALKAASDFNYIGAQLKKVGLRFFYHPHGYEFGVMGDGTLLDLMIQNTKPEFVTYEMDVFWMQWASVDPLTYLQKYPGRWELMHIKELRQNTPGNMTGQAPDAASVAVGKGITNWPAVFRAAKNAGVRLYYIEDEATDAKDQLLVSTRYLDNLK